MIQLPPWANPFLSEQNCPHCKNKTHVHGVIGIGVRQKNFNEIEPKKGDYVLTFEYICFNCSKKSLWIVDPDDLNIGLVELLNEIILMHNSESSSKKQKMSGSKISNKEIEALKKVLYNSKTYEDLLKYLGIDPEIANDEE